MMADTYMLMLDLVHRIPGKVSRKWQNMRLGAVLTSTDVCPRTKPIFYAEGVVLFVRVLLISRKWWIRSELQMVGSGEINMVTG